MEKDISILQFSVAMSVYKNDNPEHFKRAYDSITTEQTVKPNEIVLIVDGPIGEELNNAIIAFEQRDLFLKVIRLEKNQGLGNALRIAVESCSNEIIARMDSDDVAVSNRFEEQLKYFAKIDDLDIVGGDISEFIDSEENIVAYREVPTQNTEIYKYLKVRCPLNHVTVMYKKSAVLKAGGYLDLHWNEDYYLWIRMAEINSVMANTGTVLVNVRTGADMYKRRGGKKYYQSEKFLQKYMLERNMITKSIYRKNLLKRWIVQVAMPNWLRGWVFKTLARKRKKS